jgi:oligoribonuclease
MTGLNSTTDSILSVSCLITDAHLNLLDTRGFDAIIQTPSSTLSAMDEWCTRTHTASGLTTACLASTTIAESAAADLLAYVRSHVPRPGTALLAGNSIHADRAFLSRPPWDAVLGYLHYRVLDVSSIKEAVRRWAPQPVLEGVPRKRLRHEARADVEESIEEAAYYMGILQGGEDQG